MQTLDLFDQQQNRFSGCAKIMIAIGMKTHAPGTKLLDLALVQPIAQGRSIQQGLAPQSNSVALGSSPRAQRALVGCGLWARTECRASSNILRRLGCENGYVFFPIPNHLRSFSMRFAMWRVYAVFCRVESGQPA